MGIKILHAGLYSTIQDLGRFHYQKFGVIISGVMDQFAARIANILVGNAEREAVIETMMFGMKIEVNKDTVIAITGSNMQPLLDGTPIPMWRPVLVQKGSILSFPHPKNGLFTYIAFSGGLQVPATFGSKSTYISANIGGYEGRSLQKGDIIGTNQLSMLNKKIKSYIKNHHSYVPWFVHYHDFYGSLKDNSIRVIKGKEFTWFSNESKEQFFQASFTVTPKSNRMGFQLKGPILQLMEEKELLSEGVTFGTIQVPSDGQPIILMADHQTIGGYPKIAQVISYDLGKLAQFRPNDTLQFKLVTLEEAEQLYMKREQFIAQVTNAILLKTK